MSDIDLGLVSLKEFVKLGPEYIHILKGEGLLKGSVRAEITVNKKAVRVSKRFCCEIPITGTLRNKHVIKEFPKLIFLSQTETFLCLLAHLPERLHIDYWDKNNSDNMTKKGIINRSLIVKGLKHIRKKLTSFQINISSVHNLAHYEYSKNHVSF